MSDDQEKKERKARKRSPGYPMIGLDEAIQRAKILWDKDKNNLIPLGAVYQHLGYKFVGGYGGRVVAALKKFGLISEEKGGIMLTEEAVDLALHDPLDKKYIDTVKILALKPDIYESLFNEHNGNLPSDATLKIKLFKEHGFNSDKIDGFISNFRRTIEFANLQQSQAIEKEKTSTVEQKMDTATNSPPSQRVASFKPSTFVNDTEERILATYTIARGSDLRISISGPPTTKDAITKWLKRLNEDEDLLIESIADEKPATTNN